MERSASRERVREPHTDTVHDLIKEEYLWATVCHPRGSLVRTWKLTDDHTTCPRCLARRVRGR